MLVNPMDLDLWIENEWNVLFTGKHGVGKSAIIIDTFNRHNLKWLYFSAATMDPWVDFIGVPKEMGEGDNTYLGLVRPEHFHNDEVEAIMMDEFNRSAKKVRNAVMELIQFKSINGKKFNNLKIVWAAINPEESEEDMQSLSYDVEPIDPAQKDRFQIQIEIPYQCDKKYFSNKYGNDWAVAAVSWWDKLSEEQKDLVSPRRLDYALTVHKQGGDMRHVLSKQVNISMLVNKLVIGNMSKFIENLKIDYDKAKKWLKSRTNFDMVRKEIMTEENFDFFFPFFPKEEIANYIVDIGSSGENFRNKFINESFINKHPEIREIIADVLNANRRNKSMEFEAVRKIIEKYREAPKIIPRECVGLKVFIKNMNDNMSKKIDYVTSLSNTLDIKPHIKYYEYNPKSTAYRKNFLSLLVKSYTFEMDEKECTILVDIIFEILKSFQISTIHGCKDFGEAFVLILKTIELKNFAISLELFQTHMKNLDKSCKDKLCTALKEYFSVSDYDMDRFIEAESFV